MRQYQRYLPTLQLKKQQLQVEILNYYSELAQKERAEEQKRHAIESWSSLLAEPDINIENWVRPKENVTGTKNIAGVDLPVFVRAEFAIAEYDLFTMPLWVDAAIDLLKAYIALLEEVKVIKNAIAILKHELRITTQRVNLFEKVKIPEAHEAIRVIKIYIGDQLSNAVGRSKMAKRKIGDVSIFSGSLI